MSSLYMYKYLKKQPEDLFKLLLAGKLARQSQRNELQ